MDNKRNYAIENGYKFYMYYDTVMNIADIPENDLRYTSKAQFMIDSKQLYKTLHDAVKSLNNYSKPVLYHGENINVWQPDLFVKYNPYNGEFYRDYHFDSSILDKYEKLA